ncbi:MAG TPA: pseudouridine synthase [Marinagarivorans sp.]
MRLDRFVANNSGLSRKDATAAIRAGRVTVDGKPCRSASLAITAAQCVALGQQRLTEPTALYWMLNKPLGVVCANSDANHPTVFDLLDLNTVHPSQRHNLQIAGRLDIDTTGLVLITSDGQWNHNITSPNKAIGKRYRVTTEAPITRQAIAQLEAGIALRNEAKTTKPAKVIPLFKGEALKSDTLSRVALAGEGSYAASGNAAMPPITECLLEICEGKYHQVKRMFAATGNKVIALHRESIANICLDPTLEPGQYRPLTAQEVAAD